MDNIFNRAHEVYNSFFNPYKNLKPAELNNKLLEASKTGNVSEVSALLGYGADINTTDDDKRTPLMWACANEHPDIVAYLLENKANKDLGDRNGSTAVMFAVESNKNTVILECLIKSGANIKATNSFGNNALMYACMNGHTGTAAFLLQNGADINAKNNNGDNALILACWRNKTDTAYLLLNRMTPEEREEFANQNDENLGMVNNFKENLRENALSVFKPWKKANETLFCVFEQLPFELRVIISDFSAQLKFKDSWYRFFAFDTMNLEINLCKPDIKHKIILPVLFSNESKGKRKAEGEPEENNRPAKKICSGEKMETDESPKLTIFSNKK